MNGRILIVDDERSMCELLETDLRLRDFASQWFTSADKALQALDEGNFDAVLTDLKMPGTTGLQLCEKIVANRPDIPVIVMTAFGSLETAVSAIRVAAFDFVTKPIEMDLRAIALQRAVTHRRLKDLRKLLRERAEQNGRFGEMIGDSPAMQDPYDQPTRVADSEASILVTGEWHRQGAGRPLTATSWSRNAKGPFVPVNCAAIPETPLVSELFGHAKGAFTEAQQRTESVCFNKPERGTLRSWTKLARCSGPMQAKLLRALEKGKLRPAGGDRAVEA